METEELIKEFLQNLSKIEEQHKEVLLKLKIIERLTIRNIEIQKILEENG